MVPHTGEAPPDEALLLRVLRRHPTSLPGAPVSGLSHSLGLISNIGNKSRQSRV